MLELGCRQTMTGMETKRARGKCIANALVCQLCWTFLSYPVSLLGFHWTENLLHKIILMADVIRSRSIYHHFGHRWVIAQAWKWNVMVRLMPGVYDLYLWPIDLQISRFTHKPVYRSKTKVFGNLQYAYTFSRKNVAKGTQFLAV